MKLLLLVLVFGVVGTYAQSCSPVYDTNFQTIQCSGQKNGTSVVGDKENCDEFPNCCMDGDDCAIRAPKKSQSRKASLSEAEEDGLLKDALKKARESKDEDPASPLRSLVIGSALFPPGLPKSCIPPVPFPGNCRPTRNEPFVLEPPINIPYCLRIPCACPINPQHEKSQRACGMQPGCYFDKELYEYREAFGDSVLPGVPVCYLAIRNRFFQDKAQTVVAKYGSWNPYFTNCLLKEFMEEIRKGPKGCELLPILEVCHIALKLAGWSNINSYECALIDGCWIPRRGCFYPVDINNIYREPCRKVFGEKEIIYGRPKCQHFDTSSPLNILKSYHRCLSAGCCVDSSVIHLYYNLLYSVGMTLTVEQHWKYWDAVMEGLIGAFNIEQMIKNYPTDPPSEPDRHTNVPSNPFTVPWPEPPKPTQFPGFPPKKPTSNHPMSGYMPHKKVDPCGFAFKSHGARPCAPPVFRPLRPNNYCPYKPFSVPRFPTLKGRFDGCCDINLCYCPKSKRHSSGPSHYYTEWSLFSVCSASCGGGVQKRSRKCISHEPKLCTERVMESKLCNIKKCCSWSGWGSWTPCSKTCGIGAIQTRRRRCLPTGCRHCIGSAEEVDTCDLSPCDRDDWSWEWPNQG